MIPKKIFFTCIFDKNLPEYASKNIKSWKYLMPDYCFNLITNADEIFSGLPQSWAEKFHSSKCRGAKSDIARFALIYKNGGYYIDLDIIPQKTFESEINANLEGVWATILQDSVTKTVVPEPAFFGSDCGSDFLKVLLDSIDIEILKKQKSCFESTGYYFLNNFFCNRFEEKFITPGKYKEKLLLLSPSIILAKTCSTVEEEMEKNLQNETCGIHIFKGSWWRKAGEPGY